MFSGLVDLVRVRREQPALTPYGTQQVERLDDRVFAVRRGAGTPHELLCVANVTAETVALADVRGVDVLSGVSVTSLELDPYGFAWVRPVS